MNEPESEIRFNEKDYQRPNLLWRCGEADEGRTCPLGPNAAGVCRADLAAGTDGPPNYAECFPHKKRGLVCGDENRGATCPLGPTANGKCQWYQPSATGEQYKLIECRPKTIKLDRFECSRSNKPFEWCKEGPLPNGQCSQMVPPCHPVRSVLGKRKQFTFTVFALSIGVVLLLVASPWRHQWMSPGPLTSQHSVMENNCRACHTAGQDNLPQWASAALMSQAGKEQSQLCLKCHQLGEFALNPHKFDPKQLALTSERMEKQGRVQQDWMLRTASEVGLGGLEGVDQLICASCHQEHRGQNFDLNKLTDRQCQTCHFNTFSSFNQGHPEFTDYPFALRTHINYNHATHDAVHFSNFSRIMPRGTAPKSCQSCHVLDSAGRSMPVAGFEQACSSCHDRQIKETALLAPALFALPRLDVETLKAKSMEMGIWPTSQAKQDKLPAFMQMLFSQDEAFRLAQQTVQTLNLSSLESANDQQLQDVSRYVWAIKRQLLHWSTLSQTDLRSKLQAMLQGKQLTHSTVDLLLATWPDEALQKTAAAWFPTLAEEVAAHSAGQPLSSLTPAETAATDSSASLSPSLPDGWYVDELDWALKYKALKHGDRFLQAWLESSASFVLAHASPEELTPNRQAWMQVFQDFSRPSSSGRCMKCHTAEQTAGGNIFIPWNGQTDHSRRGQFTKFGHRPHLTLLGQENCGQCHQQHPFQTFSRPEFVHSNDTINYSNHPSGSNFANLNKSNCTTCHRAGGTDQQCLTCHNYHVVPPSPLAPSSILPHPSAAVSK